MIGAVTLACITAISESYVLKLILDHLSQSADTQKAEWAFILAGILFAIYLLQNVFFRISGFVGIRVLPTIRTEFRVDLFRHLRGHSQRFFSNHFSGSLSQKVVQAGRAIDNLIADLLWDGYVAICVALSGIVLLATVSPLVAVTEIVLLSIYLILATKIIMKGLPLHKQYADARSRTTGYLADTVGNILSVITFAAQKREQSRIQDVCLAENEKQRASWRYQEYVRIFNDLATAIIIVCMIGVGIVFWKKGVASVGDIAMIFSLTASLANAARSVSQQMLNVSEKIGDIRDALEIISVPHDIQDLSNARPLNQVRGEVTYDNVSFVYPEGGARLFNNLNVHIPAGQRVALVGPSGSGKTSLGRLLLRMYEPESGAIYVDGKDISTVTQASLRDHISVVSQDPALFHRSLRENIAYGKPSASFAEVEDAARFAYIHDFISSLTEGYQTFVGERGVKLSGGQKQRVAIARAILKDAPILLFDEATSSLDSESEYFIQQALEPLMRSRTVLCIAHRLSTIQHFDRILVFREGYIVEDGDHATLVSLDGIYANLWNRQSESVDTFSNLSFATP